MSIEGVQVNSVAELQEQVSRHRPGEVLKVVARRKSEDKTFSVTLKGKNGKTTLGANDLKNEKSSLKGSEFSGLSREEKLALKITQGVKINKVGGALKNAGVPQGFVITSIDKKPVYTPKDVKDALENKKDVVLISGIGPDGKKGHYAVNLEE